MEGKETLQLIKIGDIKIPEKRLRSRLNLRNGLFKLSIKNEGVLQPIHVIEDEKGVRWLVDGQNRLEAWVKEGHSLIPAIIKKGDRIEAILGSAKHNIWRGKVNPGELAEFIAYLRDNLRLSCKKISVELCLSEGYLSKLATIAKNKEILEKVKNGEISLKEAYNKLLTFTVKPISEKKSSFEEANLKHEASERHVEEPLTDADLGITTSLRQAMEESMRFKPLDLGDFKPEESKKTEYMTCDFCGKILSRIDVKWIHVHANEYDRALLAIKREAEREARNGSSQP